MKTKAMTRAGTLVQITSLLACIATFVLISAPTHSTTRTAHAEHIALATPLPPTTSAQEIVVTDSHLSVLAYGLAPDTDYVDAETVEPPIPECEWTPKARVMLRRMVLVESSSGRDAAPIAWTMARRWRGIARFRGESFADYVENTSAILRAHRAFTSQGIELIEAGKLAGLSEHQIRSLGDDAPNRVEVDHVLEAWARGDVPDPCVGGESFQWSSRAFRMSTRRVDCGDTANRFHALPRISHATYLARAREPVDECPGRVASRSPRTPR